MRRSRTLSAIFFLSALAGMVVLAVCLLFAGGTVEGTGGMRLDMRYSSLLSIAECDGYTVVDVANPWGAGNLQRYLLVPKGSELPSSLPAGVVIRTPVERALFFSGVHVALFEELGAHECIKAVCDAEYIYSPVTLSAIENGDIMDCGSSLDIDLERVAVASPEALFVLPFENGGYGKADRLGVPLIECADYMESSPLGCAEWVRFYGRLVGKGTVADSIFNAVCNEYEALCHVSALNGVRPTVMCELKGSSAWYVPAGGSTMGHMYSDAGADYIFSHIQGTGSVPLSFEAVLEEAADADVWLMKYNSPVERTYSSLLADFSGYSHFRPFKERNIYVCNTRNKRVFEESSFHPERLLKELVALFHPSLFPGYKLKYYEKMCQ